MGAGERTLIQIRRLGAKDGQASLGILAQIKLQGAESAVDEADMARFLGRSENVLLVARTDEVWAGFLLAYVLDRLDSSRPMVLLYELEVAVAHRCNGVGTELLMELQRECDKLQATKTWTLTDMTNEPACRLYQKAGGRRNPVANDVVFVFDQSGKPSGG